ncbi:MAG: VanZ family protein, partial [Salinivirgaceae bacterium]
RALIMIYIRRKNSRFAFWAVIIAMLAVSSVPSGSLSYTQTLPVFQLRLDYLLHFAAYFIIGSIGATAYNQNWKFILFLLIFIVMEEGHQYWVPFRTFNLMDLLSDFLGAASGILAVTYAIRNRWIELRG